MADIELIIKIDEKLVEWINKYYNYIKGFNGEKIGMVVDAIKNGKSIPKGHGRLIDADWIQFENNEFDTYSDYSRAFDAIDYAPTIIEADKEESEIRNG